MQPGAVLAGRYHWSSGRIISGYNGFYVSRPDICCAAFQEYVQNGEYRFVGLRTGTYNIRDMDGGDSVSVVAGETVTRDWYSGTVTLNHTERLVTARFAFPYRRIRVAERATLWHGGISQRWWRRRGRVAGRS